MHKDLDDDNDKISVKISNYSRKQIINPHLGQSGSVVCRVHDNSTMTRKTDWVTFYAYNFENIIKTEKV